MTDSTTGLPATTLPVEVRVLLEEYGPRTVIAFGSWITETCPNCGGDVHGIDDPYRGYSKHITNYREVELELRHEADVYSRRYAGPSGTLTEPYPIVDAVAQEASCMDCSFSYRAYFPRHLSMVAAVARAAHGGDDADDDETTPRTADDLLAVLADGE